MSEEAVPVIKDYPGFGELLLGSSSESRVVLTALCMLDDPRINQYFLDNKLKMVDRITKTRIFPRNGMSLLGGVVYELPEEVTPTETLTEIKNES